MVYIYSLVWEVNFRLISSSITEPRILAPPYGVERARLILAWYTEIYKDPAIDKDSSANCLS